MKNFNIKIIVIYILIFLYTIFINFIGYRYNFYALITPLFWIILFILAYNINKDYFKRVKFQTTKIQTIFIIVTIYLILNFISGLFLGYSKSIYNHSIIGIIKNVWIYIFPIIFIEYIRQTLVTHNKCLINDIIVVILFTLISINIVTIFNFQDYTSIFKNIMSIILPTIASNILLTYISKTCGYYGNLFYRIPQILVKIIIPILPNLDWYYNAIIGIILPLVIYVYIKNINDKIEIRDSKRKLKANSIYKLFYIIIPLIFFSCFVAGLFKYKPTAILSNSMKPKISRGDIVITEKNNKKELNDIKKYDIIEYRIDNTIIVHRVINIEEHSDGTKLYTTMGDNNNSPDIKKIEQNQIIGKIKFKIPKVGYPSVLLSEFLNKKKTAPVETGK